MAPAGPPLGGPAEPPEPPDRPTTIGEGGARRWLYPAAFAGRWLVRRNVINAILMAIFFALPWLRVGGHQAVLFDIPGRKLALFGLTLWPQDTLLFWLLLVCFFVGIFLVTAQWGRLWCGWACPQTVFMEGVFRRIEHWIEGDHNARRKLDAAPWTRGKVVKKALKHAAFLVVSTHVANTFICYFVGSDRVVEMTLRSPAENPGWFAFMATVNLLVYFDFAWFREQLCVVACPYGRWQSVLLDEHSLIVGYDKTRGEPRGTVGARRAAGAAAPPGAVAQAQPEPVAAPASARTPLAGVVARATHGDCIDCRRCVDVCPTGIDIRQGLQMECVNCTACIDACDAVMDKVGLPRGLIRYTSLNELDHKPRRALRGRTIGYGVALAVALTAFGVAATLRKGIEVQVLRGVGRSVQRVDGLVINHLRAKVVNKTEQEAAILVRGPAHVRLAVPHNPWPVPAGSTATMEIFVEREARGLPSSGETIRLVFEQDGQVIYERDVKVLAR